MHVSRRWQWRIKRGDFVIPNVSPGSHTQRNVPRTREQLMNPRDQTVIVIRRPDVWAGPGRSFIVWIDGRRAGKIKTGKSGEFTVEPGTHIVTVSMDWVRSRSSQVVVEPGSRTELVIRGRSDKPVWWMNLLPIIGSVVIAQLTTGVLLQVIANPNANWWVRTVFFLIVYFVVYAGFVLVTSVFSRDYWAMWTLERVGATSTSELVMG